MPYLSVEINPRVDGKIVGRDVRHCASHHPLHVAPQGRRQDLLGLADRLEVGKLLLGPGKLLGGLVEVVAGLGQRQGLHVAQSFPRF